MTNISPQIGLLRRGTIIKYNPGQSVVRVAFDMSTSDSSVTEYNMSIPGAWMGPDGQFLGGSPKIGSSVICGQEQGGTWFILSYIPSNKVFLNTNTVNANNAQKNIMSALKDDRWLLQTKNGIRVFGDPDIGIQSGNANNFIQINPVKNIVSHNLKQELFFTEATRSIKGIVKRDLIQNSNRNITSSTLDSQDYDDALFGIALDPTSVSSITTSGSIIRNPPLVENREITYETANSFQYTNDKDEAVRYENQQQKIQPNTTLTNRRDSRADTLSLSLVSPNQLIESVKGTVVDVYGNILDLNRNALPIGKINELSLRNNPDKKNAFVNIREQLRKSLAYHFEINARKSVETPDISSTVDYARDRSRFYIDIDKEGQIKLNIPASSEVGNVPLLTRYENFSTLYAAQNNSNPNEFLRNVDKVDIFNENFATKPLIKLTSGSSELDGYQSPIDRNTQQPIMLGTAYHDILDTISSRIRPNPTYPYYDKSLLSKLPNYLRPVVSKSVIVSGKNANAGGRSGTLNFDGSLALNVGANTVDRQSLWYDFAGGVVGNIGRDKNNISYALSTDGDIIISVGGKTAPSNDSRFSNLNNSLRSGSIDIRVVKNDGQMTIVRIDSDGGVSIATPGRVDIVAGQTIKLKSKSNLILDAEQIIFYGDSSPGRVVNRTGFSI